MCLRTTCSGREYSQCVGFKEQNQYLTCEGSQRQEGDLTATGAPEPHGTYLLRRSWGQWVLSIPNGPHHPQRHGTEHSVQFPTKATPSSIVTSPQSVTCLAPDTRLGASPLQTSPPPHLPTDLLRTQAIRHGAQFWCRRFDVCHTNFQETHILFF